MKKYLVETRATVRRFYYVDASDPRAAEDASCNRPFDHEEDGGDEETMSITEVVEADAPSELETGK